MCNWLSETQSCPNIPYQEIINGKYDRVFKAFAVNLSNLEAPIFLRFKWEMDLLDRFFGGGNFGSDGNQFHYEVADKYSLYGDPDYLDAAERYIDMWVHVYDLFEKEGADNVIWVWSPSGLSWPEESWNTLDLYYPGGEYVDWIGTTIANFGYNSGDGWSLGWWSFDDFFDQQRTDMSITKFHYMHPEKPIMIAEMGSAEQGGNKAEWIQDAFSVIKNKYPYVKAVVWFSIEKERHWEVDSSDESLEAYHQSISDPYFLERPILEFIDDNN